MSKIYTKYGDKGFTYTKFDAKTPKNHYVVNFLGELDELNSYIGFLNARICLGKNSSRICDNLKDIMSKLFEIGAFVGYGTKIGNERLELATAYLENEIDAQEAENGALHNFILPTGSENAALAHIARSVCRRVERQIYNLEQPKHYEWVMKYINRLSDYLFSLARTINRFEGIPEILWQNNK